MKPSRKVARRPVLAQVISLDAYRRARAVPEMAPRERDEPDTAPRERDGIMTAYCRWLALAGAIWAFWW